MWDEKLVKLNHYRHPVLSFSVKWQWERFVRSWSDGWRMRNRLIWEDFTVMWRLWAHRQRWIAGAIYVRPSAAIDHLRFSSLPIFQTCRFEGAQTKSFCLFLSEHFFSKKREIVLVCCLRWSVSYVRGAHAQSIGSLIVRTICLDT